MADTKTTRDIRAAKAFDTTAELAREGERLKASGEVTGWRPEVHPRGGQALGLRTRLEGEEALMAAGGNPWAYLAGEAHVDVRFHLVEGADLEAFQAAIVKVYEGTEEGEDVLTTLESLTRVEVI